AWINLDENDREIRQFFAYLVFAFEDAGVSLGYLKRAAENGFVDMSFASIVASLLNAVIQIDDHMVLVLDDYHRVASDDIDDFVKTLSDQCGDTVHIAIGSRNPVDIDLPTMLVAGRAIEIPSFKLRFSDQEVKEAMGANIDQQAIDELQTQVEGWPVAVQMTRLLENKERIDVRSRRHIAGSQGHIADYLVTNILRSQPDELQEFLLETSILESFSAALADAVCDHQKSSSLIRQLKNLQALVIPLDDDFEWFRYHHLFSECLSDLLKHEDPEKFAELHRRAAKWCSENRLIAEAVDYANAIEDYDLSKQIINDNCAWMRALRFGGAGYFNGLLANIPEEEIRSDPRILFSKAYACMLVGHQKNALHYHNLAEALIERDRITPELLQDRLHVGTLIIARAETASERGGGWLKERLEQASAFADAHPEARFLCAVIGNTLGLSSAAYGDFDIAQEQMVAAYMHCKDMVGVTTVYTQIGFGTIALWTNRWDEAHRYFEDAADTVVQFAGERSNLGFICETLLQTINYWQSGIEDVPPRQLEHALLNMVEGDAWADIYCTGFDAIIHDKICRGDFDDAEQLIGKLENCNERLGNERIAQFAHFLRLNCAVARENQDEAGMIFKKICGWLDADEETLDKVGWFHRTTAAYSCARYLQATGRYEEAHQYVERGLEDVDSLDVVLLRARGRILKASLLERMQRQGEAIEALAGAMEDAVRIGCARAFAGDVSSKLLKDAAKRAGGRNQAPAIRDFIERLTSGDTEKLLTDREANVLQGLADGQSNKEIARALDLAENTVKFHVRNIYRKLGVKKRVNAVARARELGIVS
ncbi:MAG: LuxR C-terminal-related transcriptional regulator, partial [Pseudomonadota bacterium]